MYVQTYHSICDDKLRIQIDMTRVEVILERTKGTQIITSSDTYVVDEPFEVVEAAWQAAILFELTGGTS
jgi:hypothetical protein